MDLARSASLPTSRASTSTLMNCERLQITESDLRKFSILHINVSYTIDAIASFSQDDDPELTDLYIRQDYLYERQQAAITTHTRRNPAIAISQLNQANQVVTQPPIITNSNAEDNSPQTLILKTLQSTIQALTVLTQQVAALSFTNSAPQPKKPKKSTFKKRIASPIRGIPR
ncbi:hypothetical protein TNCV_2352451 [Trichonephila clavipes]|nr:hypothetical protein TNCV_2352451 [Trichonephila clavipes]